MKDARSRAIPDTESPPEWLRSSFIRRCSAPIAPAPACCWSAKGVAYTEIDIIEEPARRDEMIRRAGGRTSVPQIFINGEHIGGSDELVALDRAGELDAKLGSAK